MFPYLSDDKLQRLRKCLVKLWVCFERRTVGEWCISGLKCYSKSDLLTSLWWIQSSRADSIDFLFRHLLTIKTLNTWKSQAWTSCPGQTDGFIALVLGGFEIAVSIWYCGVISEKFKTHYSRKMVLELWWRTMQLLFTVRGFCFYWIHFVGLSRWWEWVEPKAICDFRIYLRYIQGIKAWLQILVRHSLILSGSSGLGGPIITSLFFI
jgi:hypothetical protein